MAKPNTSSSTSRRDWLKQVAGGVTAGFVVFKTEFGDVRALIEPRHIAPVTSPQTISDIIIGAAQSPADVQYIIEFFTAGNPHVTVLQAAINLRATFRWVAPPEMEIRVPAGDKLVWRVARMGGDLTVDGEPVPALQVAVFTRGKCLVTNRVVCNQCDYL